MKLLLTEISVHTGNICSDIQGAWTSLRSVPRGGGALDSYKYGEAGSIVWGLGFWLGKIFWGSSKILIWTIVRG